MSVKQIAFALESGTSKLARKTLEVEVFPGFPDFKIIGVSSKDKIGHKERLRFAFKNAGFKYSHARQTINLFPDTPTNHTHHLDLALAIGLLIRTNQIKVNFNNFLLLGCLNLDGSLQTTDVINQILEQGLNREFNFTILPANPELMQKFKAVPNLFFCKNLNEAIQKLKQLSSYQKKDQPDNFQVASPSFENIYGLDFAKKALILAVARRHKLLLIGFPGVGKSMLAKSVQNLILDPNKELVEVLAVSTKSTFISSDPANNLFSKNPDSILVINELPELKRECIESLRYLLDLPNRCTLIATMNPCRCGYQGHDTIPCKCSVACLNAFKSKVPPPIIDRFDIIINLNSEPNLLQQSEIQSFNQTEKARAYIKYFESNSPSSLDLYDLNAMCEPSAKVLLNEIVVKFKLSPRRIFKLLNLALSLSLYNQFDTALESNESPTISTENLIESLAYQSYVIPKIKNNIQHLAR